MVVSDTHCQQFMAIEAETDYGGAQSSFLSVILTVEGTFRGNLVEMSLDFS